MVNVILSEALAESKDLSLTKDPSTAFATLTPLRMTIVGNVNGR